VLNCTTELRSQTRLPGRHYERGFLSCAKARENYLGTETHREQCASFLWATP